jgi:hypothetical protein
MVNYYDIIAYVGISSLGLILGLIAFSAVLNNKFETLTLHVFLKHFYPQDYCN